MIRHAFFRALQILAVAAALVAIYYLSAWLTATDRQVERASLEAYCGSVAQWQAEASRGIAPERRTGHPDYDDKATEVCPGMRPAGLANHSGLPNRSTERQLAQQ